MIVTEVTFRDDVRPVREEWPDAALVTAGSFVRTMRRRPDVKRVAVTAVCRHPRCPWCGPTVPDSQSEPRRPGL